jgi:hypothetical protein
VVLHHHHRAQQALDERPAAIGAAHQVRSATHHAFAGGNRRRGPGGNGGEIHQRRAPGAQPAQPLDTGHECLRILGQHERRSLTERCFERSQVLGWNVQHVGHHAQQPAHAPALFEQTLHAFRDALVGALELEQGFEPRLGRRGILPHLGQRRLGCLHARRLGLDRLLGPGQHAPRLVHLGRETLAPSGAALELGLEPAQARLQLAQRRARRLAPLAQRSLALADPLALAAALRLGREQIERKLLA